ncbi:MAG: ABC transporter permease [Bacteroidales bacterium]|nr:ABC transporter permease [Bacteroidales bacterium]MCF8389373.1 ABC transporter permease [Bacteroidales bacterium]
MLKLLVLSIESIIFAIQAVIVNRLRTLLSLLGITIGIFAIIAVFTIVDSLEINIRESLSSLGSDIIYVEKWPWTQEDGGEFKWWQYVNRPVPNIQEYELLKDRLTKADEIAFVISTRTSVQYKDNTIDNMNFLGVSSGFDGIRSFDIQSGRYFSDFELTSGKNICILGFEIANQLFGNIDPLGKIISIKGHKTRVIGVFNKEGKDTFGDSMDENVMVPINHVRNVVNIRSESMNPMIWIKSAENVSTEELKGEIRMQLRNIRRLKPKADDNFALNQTSMLNNQLDQFFGVLNMAGWFIGIFSLLVGGFGIANIMFVSVKERTKLIGVQKALGAKRFFIIEQFIFESILLAVMGGFVGLLLVYIGTLIINSTSDFQVTLTMGNIIMGLSISSLIGLISGLAPAYSAARLDPVIAINSTF